MNFGQSKCVCVCVFVGHPVCVSFYFLCLSSQISGVGDTVASGGMRTGPGVWMFVLIFAYLNVFHPDVHYSSRPCEATGDTRQWLELNGFTIRRPIISMSSLLFSRCLNAPWMEVVKEEVTPAWEGKVECVLYGKMHYSSSAGGGGSEAVWKQFCFSIYRSSQTNAKTAVLLVWCTEATRLEIVNVSSSAGRWGWVCPATAPHGNPASRWMFCV